MYQAPNKKRVSLAIASSFHRGKSTNFKKKPKVKLPYGFKQKVNKALESEQVNGTWKQVSFGTLPIVNFPINQQAVGGLGAFTGDWNQGWAFDPEDWLHFASVLWNDKLDSKIARSWDSTDNLGIIEPVTTVPQDTLVDNNGPQTYYQLNTKLTIKNSHETYKMKNNSQRTITMALFLCAPKMRGLKDSTVSGPLDAPAFVATSAGTSYIGNPGQQWAASMIKQKSSNILVGTAGPNTLFMNPKSNPDFNATYKTDVTYVTLEPGQEYEYFIQGPQDFTFNFKDLFHSGDSAQTPFYNGITPWMRYPLITLHLDLVSDGTIGGRLPSAGLAAQSQSLTIERTIKAFLVMPEIVGNKLSFITAVAGATVEGRVQNTQRRDCYSVQVYSTGGALGAVDRIDVQDPTFPIDLV